MELFPATMDDVFPFCVSGSKTETWVIRINKDGDLVQQDVMPFYAQQHSPDLRNLFGGNKLWQSERAAVMMFPPTNRIDCGQGKAFYLLPESRAIYITKDGRCVMAELLANGRTREVAVLADKASAVSVNRDGTRAIVVKEPVLSLVIGGTSHGPVAGR